MRTVKRFLRMRANMRHYCNFVSGNDEKWLVKQLTAVTIGYRLFARSFSPYIHGPVRASSIEVEFPLCFVNERNNTLLPVTYETEWFLIRRSNGVKVMRGFASSAFPPVYYCSRIRGCGCIRFNSGKTHFQYYCDLKVA